VGIVQLKGVFFTKKELNYLIILPLYGTCILFFYLFVKVIKNEINRNKMFLYLMCSAFFGFLSILVVALFLRFIENVFGITDFFELYGMIFAFIIGGYFLNIFSFTLINKNYDKLQK
jgi:hypothetical protein